MKNLKLTKISVFKPEIRIILRKQLVRELGPTNPFEFFKQHLGRIDVSSVQFFRISCNLVKRLTRYEQKQKGTLFLNDPVYANQQPSK